MPPAEASTCLDAEPTVLPAVPLARRTEHLDIYSTGTVCMGTAVEFERHVSSIAEAVGVDLRPGIPVVLGQTPAPECAGIQGLQSVIGCTKPDGTVFATPEVAYHELGHAVGCQLRSGNLAPALVEGFAVMFQPQLPTEYGLDEAGLEGLLDADYGAVYYLASGHFSRWLYEYGGPTSFAEFYVGQKVDLVSTLESVYELSFETLADEYSATAGTAWVPLAQCENLPHVQPDPDGVWQFADVIDCDASSTFGPYLRRPRQLPAWDMMGRSFSFTVESETKMDYALVGVESVFLERCPDGDLVDPSEFDVAQFATKDGLWEIPTLAAGDWRADVLTLKGPSRAVEVSFWPDPD